MNPASRAIARRSLLPALFLLSFLVPLASADPVAGPKEAWCLAHLLHKGPLCDATCDFEPMRDLFSAADTSALLPPLRIVEAADDRARYEFLKSVPIERVTAAPGHGYLRNPKQLESLKEYIRSSGGGDFRHDRILVNIITDAEDRVVTVDLWNAHHRLVAYLEAGFHWIGQIPSENFKILVNGRTFDGSPWPHFLPLAGIDETKRFDYRVVPPDTDIKGGTVAVDGRHPNFVLGSRNSIAQLRRNMLYRKIPKIGVFFGTFDPPHEGHRAAARKAMETLELDEVVFVPNPSPNHKLAPSPLDVRVGLLRKFVEQQPRMNAYVGPSGMLIDRFGRDPFVERMVQTYGTHDVYQIIGEDSFEQLVRENAIHPKSNRKYYVVARPDEHHDGKIVVPDALREVVTVAEVPGGYGLSSTLVRKIISEGGTPPASLIDAATWKFIEEQGLYRAKPR